MNDSRYCTATWRGYRCELRDDHDGQHRDLLVGVSWPRLFPPGDGA